MPTDLTSSKIRATILGMVLSKYCRHCCRLLGYREFRTIVPKKPRRKPRDIDGGQVINQIEKDEGYSEPAPYQFLSAWCKECEARRVRMKVPVNGPRKSHRESSYYTRQRDAQKELVAFLMRQRRDRVLVHMHRNPRPIRMMD